MSDKEGRHEPARSVIPVPSQDLVPISGTIQAPNDRWRAQDIVFAFGPKDTYFISTSPDQWRFRLDSNNAREVKSLGIARPASFALIAYGSYIAVYSRDDGGMNIAKGGSRQRMISSTEATEWVEAHAAFDGVFKFLGQDGDGDVKRQASFCVGPEGTWFARRGNEADVDAVVAYNKLPQDLEQQIETRKQKGLIPWQVTLGKYGSYVVLWSDLSTCSYSLNGYKDLAKYLDEIGDRPNTVVLSPYDNRDWFLVQDSGYVLWQLHGNPESLGDIARLGREYMQRVAKARGQTFVTTSDGTQHVITPDTNYIYDKVPEPRANQWVLELARIEKSLHAGLEDARRRMEALHSRFEAPSLLQDKKHPAIVVTGTATPVLLGWLLYRQRMRTTAATASVGPKAQSRTMPSSARVLRGVATTAAYLTTGYLCYVLGGMHARSRLA